jgi:hypothetical protein
VRVIQTTQQVYLLVYVVRGQDGHLHRYRLDAVSPPSLLETFNILIVMIVELTTVLRVQL